DSHHTGLGDHEMSGVRFFGGRSRPRSIRSRNCVRGFKARGKFFYLSTWHGKLLKPISDLRFCLDLFPDPFALAAHQTLIPNLQTARRPSLLKPTLSFPSTHLDHSSVQFLLAVTTPARLSSQRFSD